MVYLHHRTVSTIVTQLYLGYNLDYIICGYNVYNIIISCYPPIKYNIFCYVAVLIMISDKVNHRV